MIHASKLDERAWLALVAAARDPADPAVVLAAVKGTAGRTIPCAAHRDQAAFVALQALARAYGEGLKERRHRLAACLSGLAEECARAADWPSAPRPPQEPVSWAPQDLFETRRSS
ncbi:MAG: hypothetical protein ACYDD1_03050 [Caulobacteraceae bacterium]